LNVCRVCGLCRGQSFRRISRRDHRSSCASFKPNVARVFALRKYDFQIVSACRRLRFHIHCFLTRPEVGTYYVFVFPVWFVRACLRCSLNRPRWNCVYNISDENNGSRSTTIENRSAALRGVLTRLELCLYNDIYIYILCGSRVNEYVAKRLIDP